MSPTPTIRSEGITELVGDIALQGGWSKPAVSGNGPIITSVDTLNRDNPVLPLSLPSPNSAGVIGGTLTLSNQALLCIDEPGRGPPQARTAVFFQTGFLGRAGSTTTSPVAFPNFADATGTAFDSPKFTIPVLAGLRFPVGSVFGLNVFGKVGAGVNVNRREAGFTFREKGAGLDSIPVFVSDSWTSVDPALDFGLQVAVGRWGRLPVSFGVDVLMDWSRSHTVFAQSPNFRSQSYTLDTGRGMDVLTLFNVSVALDPAPVAPTRLSWWQGVR